MMHKTNYRSAHPTAVDTCDPSTIWFCKNAHATARLGAEHPPCLENILLCSEPLVLPIL
jgi:hypothetical protein